MSEEDALLEDIVIAPYDDAPRLILADWYEDRACDADSDHAAFIRASLEYAALHSTECACGFGMPPVCHVCSLWNRKRMLMTPATFWQWTRPLLPLWPGVPQVVYDHHNKKPGNLLLVRVDWGTHSQIDGGLKRHRGVGWSRGFVEFVRLPPHTFLEHHALLFRSQPILAVHLAGLRPERTAGMEYRWVWNEERWREELQLSRPGSDVSIDDYLALTEAIAYLTNYRDFETEVEAMSAFSEACVQWGRTRAGLPALERKDTR